MVVIARLAADATIVKHISMWHYQLSLQVRIATLLFRIVQAD